MGQQKLLLPYAGRPLIRHIVESVQRGPVKQTVVVTGHSRDEIEQATAGTGVLYAHNPDHAAGMLTSIRVGIQTLHADLAPMIVLGDQPEVPVAVLTALVKTIESNPDGIVVPVYGERRGHPMVFGCCFRDEVLREFDDTGLRGLLRAHPDAVIEVQADDEKILTDLDTPEEYAAALKALRGRTRDPRT